MIQTILCSRISGQLYVSERQWNDPATALNSWERRWDELSSKAMQFNMEHPREGRDAAGWFTDAFRPKINSDEAELDASFDGWRHLNYGEYMDLRGTPSNS